MLAETLKGLTLYSTINDTAYYNSDKDDTESDQKRDPLVATHTSDGNKIKVTDTDTTNGISPQKLLINRTLPVIILLIDRRILDGIAAGRGTMHESHMIASNLIVTDAMHSGTCVFRKPADVNRKHTDGTIPWDSNTSRSSPRLTYPVLIGDGTTVYPTRMGRQEISSPKGPTVPVEFRNA